MEEIGDRTTVFEFGGRRDRQRDYIDWVLKTTIDAGFAALVSEGRSFDAESTNLRRERHARPGPWRHRASRA
jgi:hypothetical protein